MDALIAFIVGAIFGAIGMAWWDRRTVRKAPAGEPAGGSGEPGDRHAE